MDNGFSASFWIEKLGLAKHVEGGFFREIYRSTLVLPQSALTTHKAARSAATSIYFLLEAGQTSAFHRIASDELWHFYDGDPLSIYEIDSRGRFTAHHLGKSVDGDTELQVLIPAGSWFASRVMAGGKYTLCGCTVAPGFDFEDFELADRQMLTALFPEYSGLIADLTY